MSRSLANYTVDFFLFIVLDLIYANSLILQTPQSPISSDNRYSTVFVHIYIYIYIYIYYDGDVTECFNCSISEVSYFEVSAVILKGLNIGKNCLSTYVSWSRKRDLYGTKIDIMIWTPEVSHLKNAFVLFFC